MRLTDLIDEFLQAVDDGSVRGRGGRRLTRDAVGQLRWYLDGHVREALGTRIVGDVRRDDVEALVDELGATGVPRRWLRAVVKSMRALYDYAIESGLVGRNPAERIALPDEAEAGQPTSGADRRRMPLDRAISLALQLATLGFVLLALIFAAESLAAAAPARASTVAPMAVDLHELFGDENEADEDEDESEEESGRSAEDRSRPDPLGSLSAVIPIAVLGLVALWYVRRLLRRLGARFRPTR